MLCALVLAVAQEDNLPDVVHLPDFWPVAQTWNNCAGATVTMTLNHWGWQGNQAVAGGHLKPNREDKNVSPWQLAAFVNDRVPGFRALYRFGGEIQTLKRLLASGYPVMVETGFDPEPDTLGWMGHYRLLVGYNEAIESFYIFDSYLGAGGDDTGLVETYAAVDAMWQHFNRAYIVTYTPEHEAQLAEALGADWDPETGVRRALQTAQEEIKAAPGDVFAWFNLGSSYALLGDYKRAALAYDQARYIGLPERMLWYQFGPFESYLHTGRLDDVEALARAALERTPYVEEWYYYLGLVHMQRMQYADAVRQLEAAADFNPYFTPAAEALSEARTKAAETP